MFDFLRRMEKSWVIWAMYGIIILMFVGGYIPCANVGQSGPPTGTLVKAGSHNFTRSDLGMALLASGGDTESLVSSPYHFIGLAKLAGGDTSSVDRYAPFGAGPTTPLPSQRLVDELVETYLVSDFGRSLGLGVSDEAMTDRIEWAQTFRNRSSFVGVERYLSILDGRKISPARFEDFVKREIVRELVIDMVRVMTVVTDQDVNLWVTAMTETRNFGFISFQSDAIAKHLVDRVSADDAATFAADEANGAAIQEFYDRNKPRFLDGDTEKKLEDVKPEIAAELVARKNAEALLARASEEIVAAAQAAPDQSLGDMASAWKAANGFAEAEDLFQASATGAVTRILQGFPDDQKRLGPQIWQLLAFMLDNVQGIGRGQALARGVYQLNAENRVGLFQADSGTQRHLVRFIGQGSADEATLKATGDRVREDLQSMRAVTAYRSLVNELRNDKKLRVSKVFNAALRQESEQLENRQETGE